MTKAESSREESDVGDIALTDIHYCPFTARSNVYGLSHVSSSDGSSMQVLASSHSKVMCLSYHRQAGSGELIPSYKELHFPYIPADADIISVDSYRSPTSPRSIYIGITFVKLGEEQMSKFFNVYPQWQESRQMTWPHRSSFVLQFSPLHLYHTTLLPDPADVEGGEGERVVWLLTGSDGKVHLYEERSAHVVCEQPIVGAFPELSDLPSPALRIHIHNTSGANGCRPSRMTAVGCDNGTVLVSKVEVPHELPEVTASWSVKLDSPITVVTFFTTPAAMMCDLKLPACLEVGARSEGDSSDEDANRADKHSPSPGLRDKHSPSPGLRPIPPEQQHINLVVSSAIEKTVVFSHVDTYSHGGGGVERKRTSLEESECFDCVLCACVGDVDFDGRDEILLGTYGQRILIYKEAAAAGGGFALARRLAICEPVLGLAYVDVLGDGVRELLVLGLHGLHVLRHPAGAVTRVLGRRLAALARLVQPPPHSTGDADAYRQLQAEAL